MRLSLPVNKGDANSEMSTYTFPPHCYINYTVYLKYVNYVNCNDICVTVTGNIRVYLQFT